ncbi:uncharacterized protein LOC124368549 [Homalodisca vitripennis]|uniref:uncharacterized protein LOC124368549 n=1 Tax=Homalodisca vitripennis TaxID=197043 RepID=UPI001EEAF0DD|nr:uncharacterized protein LOC124368549 [Homalodisca vitripennis]KAG8330193.1 hypothetical protein J6590_068804 [Homalodisca vitripennis]
MAAVGLLCLCLLVALVGSYPLTDVISGSEGPISIPGSGGIPKAEAMMEFKADRKYVVNPLCFSKWVAVPGCGIWILLNDLFVRSGHPAKVVYYEAPSNYYYY